MNKSEVRKIMIKKRDSINNKEEMDELIKARLKRSDLYTNSKNIFIYVGFKSEINTINYINEFLEDGKRIFVPRTDVRTKNMEAVEIKSLNELEKSSYGILEPKKEISSSYKDKLDFIIFPGLAFDKMGHRIGYGAGYYDRFMKNINYNILKAALCYDFQIIDKVPYENHDVTISYIITEKREIFIS